MTETQGGMRREPAELRAEISALKPRAEEARREAERQLLRICHLAADTRELVQNLIAFFQELTGCEAVGIRLRHGEDFPYYESRGFPSRFLRTENFLCERMPDGTIVRDGSGNPVLECMCGNILRGRFNPALPFFTARGSFWTNSTGELLAATSEADRQARTRNRCNGEGYESVALIPFRLREETYGLLQLNDRARGRFTPQLIGQLEELAAYVSLSLAKHLADTFRRESEEKYRLLVECAQEAIIVTTDQRLLLVNPAAARIAGHSAAELYEKTFADLVHPDDLSLVTNRHRRRLEGRTDTELYSFRIISGDGRIKWVEVNGSLIQWQGMPATLNFITDITARKQAEAELRASEQRYRALFEHAPVATWEEDFSQVKHRIDQLRAAGVTELRDYLRAHPEELTAMAKMVRVVDINRHSIEVLGALHEDEVSRDLGSYFTGESLEIFADELAALASGKTRFEAEIPVVDVQGLPLTLALTLSIDPADLADWSRVLASFVDISDRKRTERQLRQQAMILDQISDAVTVTDLDGVTTYVNRAAAGKIVNAANEPAGGRPDSHDSTYPANERHLLAKTLAQGHWQGEVTYSTPAGRRILMDCRFNTLFDEDGRKIGICGISTDITEKRRTDDLLRARLRLNEETAALNVHGIMQMAVDEAERMTGSRIGFFYLLEADQKTIALRAWSTATVRDFCRPDAHMQPNGRQEAGVWADAIRQRQPVVHNDLSSLPGLRNIPAEHAAVERELVVPVMRGGLITAVLGVGNKACDYDRNDIELVSSLADMVLDIVLRKLAEEAMKASEQRFRSIYAVSPAGIALVNPTTLRYLRANRSFLEIVGYTEEELVQKHISDLIHPDDWAKEQRQLLEHRDQAAGVYSAEKRYIRKDGSIRRVQLMADFVQLDDAETIMIANVIDITERVRAEEITRLDEARLESLLRITQHPAYNIQELLDFVLNEAIHLTDSKIGYIYFYDEARQKFTLSSWSKNVMEQCAVVEPQTVYHLQHTGLWGEAVRQRRPIVDNDYQSPGALKKGTPAGHIDLTRFLTVPIFSDERIVAVAAVANKSRDYDDHDIRQMILMMDAVWKVVQQRRAEAEREDNIRRLRLATGSAKLGVWDWDVAGDRMLWDARMYEIYGVEPEDSPSGAIWTESLHPGDRELATAEVQAALAGQGTFDTVFRIVRGDGAVRHIKADGIVIRDHQGQALRMLGVNRDITAQYQAEEALRASEEQHRLLVRMLPDIIYHFDRRRRHIYVSENVSRYFALRPEEIIGHTVDQLGFPEGLCRQWNGLIDEAFATGRPSEMEFVIDSRLGNTIFNWRLVPQRDRDEQIRSVLILARDITAHRQAERDYRQLFDSMLDGFALHEIIVDPLGTPKDYRFLAVNPAFERMTGLKAAELAGRTVLELMPETEQYWVEIYGRVALTGQPVTFENYSGVLGKHFQVTAFQPAPRQFACIVSDITDKVKIEQERQKLEAQLRQAQKLEAIGTLAGGIAHDFNNILGAILGYAEMAREDCLPGSPLAAGSIDQVILAGQRARDLVKQILAFSRQAKIEQVPLQPSIIAKEAIKLLRSSLPATIRIAEDIDNNAGLVLADPTQIHQVLMNLCTNAYHAMEEHGGVLTISLQRRSVTEAELLGIAKALPGEYIELAVRDKGPGIPPAILERIFDPYFTTKGQGKGTGLGLAIVQKIIASCGGFVTCRSVLGEGTEFCVRIPVYRQQEKPVATEAADTAPAGGTERILFVDDEEMLVTMGRTMLQRLGYRVTGQTDSRAALDLFRQQPEQFDLVITDQTMPEMTGMALASAMRQIRPDIPIILCTGYSNLVSEASALAVGIDAFALKPIIKRDIAALIRKVLKGKAGGRRHNPDNATEG